MKKIAYKDTVAPWNGTPCFPHNDCGASGSVKSKLGSEVLAPYIRAKVLADNTLYEHPETGNVINLSRPGVNLFGISLDEYPVTTSNVSSPLVKGGGMKEWQQAKREGKILLRPRLVYKLNASGTPSLKTIHEITTHGSDAPLDLYGLSAPGSGTCSSATTVSAFPALSLDVYSSGRNGPRVVYKVVYEPYMVPIPESLLRQTMDDILIALSSIAPNKGLVTKTVAEANNATFDIATEIGEMPETIKMIIDGVKGGIKLLLRTKMKIKQNLSSGNAVSDAASLWMATRYGIMPIVYSINDGLDLLAMESRKFQSFRGRTDLPFPELKHLPSGYELLESPQVVHRCFLKYGYDLDSAVHQGLKINLAATAWELIPLSFVMDWFIQVGDYLTAYFTPGVVDQIGCMYSTKTEGSFTFKNSEGSVISINCEHYNAHVINPDSFIGINSEIFISYKRAIDAISLSWLMFKKTNK